MKNGTHKEYYLCRLHGIHDDSNNEKKLYSTINNNSAQLQAIPNAYGKKRFGFSVRLNDSSK